MNFTGPNTEPCGTLQSKKSGPDVSVITKNVCFWRLRYDSHHCKARSASLSDWQVPAVVYGGRQCQKRHWSPTTATHRHHLSLWSWQYFIVHDRNCFLDGMVFSIGKMATWKQSLRFNAGGEPRHDCTLDNFWYEAEIWYRPVRAEVIGGESWFLRTWSIYWSFQNVWKKTFLESTIADVGEQRKETFSKPCRSCVQRTLLGWSLHHDAWHFIHCYFSELRQSGTWSVHYHWRRCIGSWSVNVVNLCLKELSEVVGSLANSWKSIFHVL